MNRILKWAIDVTTRDMMPLKPAPFIWEYYAGLAIITLAGIYYKARGYE